MYIVYTRKGDGKAERKGEKSGRACVVKEVSEGKVAFVLRMKLRTRE